MSEQATIDLGKPRQQAQKERVLEHSKRRLSWARHEVREIARVSASISSFLKDLPASLNDQQTPGKAHNPWSIRQSALNKYLEDKESDRACYGGLNTSAFHRFHASRDLSSLHRSTSDSDQAKKYRFLGNAKELASSEKRANPFKRQGRRLALPVKLRGKTVLALPDTGSDIDAISMDLVKELGLRFYPYSGSKKLVRLSDGHTMTAIGKVSTRLSFAKGPQLRLRRTFYVFSKISTGVELIVGRDFLDHTQTWTRHQDRLSERPIELQGIPKVMNMSVSRRRLPCYIDSCLVLATADTGSEVDLINESYALSRGFKIDPVSEEESYIQLPGQRVAKVTGKVKVKFDTLHDAPPSPNSQKNVSSDDNAQSHLKVEQVIGHARPPSPISDHYRTLYVLPSLTSNVLLGEELLDSIDAFGTHLDSFVDFENLGRGLPDVNSIKWLNSLERKFLNKSSANSTWPPSTLDSMVNSLQI